MSLIVIMSDDLGVVTLHGKCCHAPCGFIRMYFEKDLISSTDLWPISSTDGSDLICIRSFLILFLSSSVSSTFFFGTTSLRLNFFQTTGIAGRLPARLWQNLGSRNDQKNGFEFLKRRQNIPLPTFWPSPSWISLFLQRFLWWTHFITYCKSSVEQMKNIELNIYPNSESHRIACSRENFNTLRACGCGDSVIYPPVFPSVRLNIPLSKP